MKPRAGRAHGDTSDLIAKDSVECPDLPEGNGGPMSLSLALPKRSIAFQTRDITSFMPLLLTSTTFSTWRTFRPEGSPSARPPHASVSTQRVLLSL